MGKDKPIGITIKVSPDIQKKFKLASLVSGKSMTDMFTNWIEDMEIKIPDSLISSGKQIKPKKTIKPETVKGNEAEIQKTIFQYKDVSKLSYQAIADKLNGDSISTLSGKGIWNKSTVRKQYLKWKDETD